MIKSQEKQWAEIIAYIDKFDIKSVIELVPIIKQLAINFIDDDNLFVKVNDSILHKFSTKEKKRAFISSMRKNKIWGNDAILFPFLNVLGYRMYLHLLGTDLPAYEVYEQKKRALRTLHVANHGAQLAGIHWELLEYEKGGFHSVDNKADGDCMYWVLAQAIWKDVNKMRSRLIADNKQDKKQQQLPAIIQQKKIKQEWIQYEKNDKKIQNKLHEQLKEKLITNDKDCLYNLLKVAHQLCDGDAYITSRMGSAAMCDFNELTRVLSMEAWRNPKFYSYLKNLNIVQDVNFKKFNYKDLKYYGQHVSSRGCLVVNKRARETIKNSEQRLKRPRRALVTFV